MCRPPQQLSPLFCMCCKENLESGEKPRNGLFECSITLIPVDSDTLILRVTVLPASEPFLNYIVDLIQILCIYSPKIYSWAKQGNQMSKLRT